MHHTRASVMNHTGGSCTSWWQDGDPGRPKGRIFPRRPGDGMFAPSPGLPESSGVQTCQCRNGGGILCCGGVAVCDAPRKSRHHARFAGKVLVPPRGGDILALHISCDEVDVQLE